MVMKYTTSIEPLSTFPSEVHFYKQLKFHCLLLHYTMDWDKEIRLFAIDAGHSDILSEVTASIAFEVILIVAY